MSKAEKYFLELLQEIEGATEGKMFGAFAAKMPNKKAGAMLKNDKLLVKISGKTLEEAQKIAGVQLFTPKEGRPMGGWYEIPFGEGDDWKKYMKISCDDVAKLPPNPKKTK